jgi:hypothetical protein
MYGGINVNSYMTCSVPIQIGLVKSNDRLCGLVVTVLGYRSGGPGSIPGTNQKKK